MPCILQIITKSELGGAQSHVADLLDGLRSERNELHLAAGAEGPLTEFARSIGAQVHLLPRLQRSVNPLVDLAAVRECARLFRRVRPHLAHAHSSKAGAVARLAGLRTRTPVVFTAHGWGFSPGAPRARRSLAWAVEFGAAFAGARIVCVSESDRQLALRCRVGSAAKLNTIRYGIPPEAEQAQPEVEPPRVVMVARFSEQKDQATLMRAVALLEQQQPALDYQVDLVGTGPDFEQAQALARELNVGNRVAFLGDRHDVPHILRDSQLFVLSTHYEGLPISIMEAMRAGLPVVATSVSGIPEEVEDGVNGFLVPHRDERALADALRQALSSPEKRANMGRASRQKFEREFTRARMMREIEALYQQVRKVG